MIQHLFFYCIGGFESLSHRHLLKLYVVAEALEAT